MPTLRSATRASAPSSKRRKTSAVQDGFRVPYELGPSPVAGRGVFATTPIKRGALIWEYVVGQSVLEHDEVSLRARLRGMRKAARRDLLEHVYVWEGSVIEILDDAKLWNHSKSPNTGDHPDGEGDGAGDGVSSYALRDIAAGEELTDDYSLHHALPWFEQICKDVGAESCIAVGKSYK